MIIYGEYRLFTDRTSSAKNEDIIAVETFLGVPLPIEYVWILRNCDGFAGIVKKEDEELDSAYLVFYPADQVHKLTYSYLVDELEPDMLLIGGDGGGMGFFLQRPANRIGRPTWIELPYECIGIDDPESGYPLRFNTLAELIDHRIEEVSHGPSSKEAGSTMC